MATDKSRKTQKIQEIIDRFNSQYKARTIERIYDIDDVYVVETSTKMAIKNLEPYFVIEKDSFNVKHHTIRVEENKEKLPKLQNMIYESKEVVEREARNREYNDALYEELTRLLEEDDEN